MLDLRFVVENKDRVVAMLAKPAARASTRSRAFPGLEGIDPWALDAERRETIQ